jgi:hypothetical protein
MSKFGCTRKPIHMIQALRSRCLRPFDHQKYTVVLRPFSVMLRPLLLTFFIFCYFLLRFFITCNFLKLLFTVEGSVFVTFC